MVEVAKLVWVVVARGGTTTDVVVIVEVVVVFPTQKGRVTVVGARVLVNVFVLVLGRVAVPVSSQQIAQYRRKKSSQLTVNPGWIGESQNALSRGRLCSSLLRVRKVKVSLLEVVRVDGVPDILETRSGCDCGGRGGRLGRS